ncbi:MarR family winged helix-turn-helix transcriptional regulator [Desulfospira joergensenii]|uniref:MarR family winged helix-turn-helix transcriptional regulator n=1 Tax=Desulfospira joergensenii TaxID=53329 RepID=UPI0003B68B0E|nr:MarR family transcriptional regulator [Desulfospira joergensenii]
MKPKDIPDIEAKALQLYTVLMRASNTLTEKLHRHLLDHRLSISQFGVMEALYHLGSMCQKDLGTKILKTSGNITLVIDNLEKRNLVKRMKDRSDRRRVSVTLTDSGQDLIKRIFPDHSRTASEIFSVLTPEEQQTLKVLLKKLGLANA